MSSLSQVLFDFSSSITAFSKVLVANPIIPLFLIANLAIGFWAHRKRMVDSFEDYALANRSLPTGVLVMTLLATFVATGDLAELGSIYEYGILKGFMVNAQVLLFFLVGTFVAPCLVYFNESYTLGDLLGILYGRVAQVFGGIISCVICLLIISTQIKVIGTMSKYLLGLSPSIAILCFGGLVVLYSVWGGMRSVSYTDILQAIAVLMVFSLVTKILLQKIGGLQLLFNELPSSKKVIISHPEFLSQLRTGFFWQLLPTWIFSPPLVQRMLITADKRQVRKVWYTGGILYGMICFMGTLIALAAVLAPEKLGITCDRDNLLFSLIKQLFEKRSWTIQFMFIGLLAVLLSTMDSFLHAMGITFVQDVLEPISIYFFGKEPLSGKAKVRYAKTTMLCMGVLSVTLGFLGRNLDNMAFYVYVVLVSAMTVIPMIIGVMGLKTDRTSWLSLCVTYVMSSAIFIWLGFSHYDYFMWAVFIGLIAFLITHIVQNGGIVTLKRSNQTIAEQLWIPDTKRVVQKVLSWLQAPLSLPRLAREQAIKSPLRPLAFSLLIFGLYTFSSILVEQGREDVLGNTAYFMACIHLVGIVLCCGLMLEGIWPAYLKPYFPLYWFFSVFYCLPFGGTLAFLRVHEGMMDASLWIGAFIFLVAIVDTSSFLSLSMLGISFALAGWTLFTGTLPISLWNSVVLSSIVGISIVGLSVVLFAQHKEEYMQKKLYWNRVASNTLGHELRGPLQMLGGIGNVLQNAFKEGERMKNKAGKQGFWIPQGDSAFLDDFSGKMIEKSQDLKKEIASFTKFIEQQVFGVFVKEEVSMRTVVEDGISKVVEKNNRDMEVSISCEKDFSAKILGGIFPNVITNLIQNASIHGQASELEIKIDGVNRKIYVRDDGKGIPPDVLPRIFDLHYTTDAEKTNTGVGLAFVKMAIAASGGKISCQSRYGTKNSFTEFIIELPKENKKS